MQSKYLQCGVSSQIYKDSSCLLSPLLQLEVLQLPVSYVSTHALFLAASSSLMAATEATPNTIYAIVYFPQIITYKLLGRCRCPRIPVITPAQISSINTYYYFDKRICICYNISNCYCSFEPSNELQELEKSKKFCHDNDTNAIFYRKLLF